MPRKKKSHTDTFNSKSGLRTLRKYTEHDYWRYEYTRRKFYLDLENQLGNKYSLHSELGLEHAPKRLKCIQGYVARTCIDIFQISKCPTSPQKASELSWKSSKTYHWTLSALIQVYIDSLHRGDPNFRFDSLPKLSLILDHYDIHSKNKVYRNELVKIHQKTPFWIECIAGKMLSQLENHEQLNWLSETSYKYGFFPWQMIMLDDLLECLNFYNCNNVPPCLCEPFLKQESQLDKYGIEVHFADNDGRQFYAAEDDRNTLYCYVSCMDDSPSPKKIVLSIETAIYAFRKKRITNRFGDKTKSVIQLCINMSKLDVGQIKNILRLLEIQFIKYRNWLSPQEHLFDPDNLLTLNKLGVVPREQTSFRSRSIGLWIWDQVHIHGDMQIDAIEKAIELKSLAIGENGHWSDLNRKYRLAKLCIDKMEVLNLTAL